MPCDSVRTTSIDLSAIGRIDITLLGNALTDLGFTGVSVHKDQGVISFNGGRYVRGNLEIYSGRDVTIDNVKQSYSAQVVKQTAKRFGWTLKETGKFQYEVIKR